MNATSARSLIALLIATFPFFSASSRSQERPAAQYLRQTTGETTRQKVTMAVVSAEDLRGSSHSTSQRFPLAGEQLPVTSHRYPAGYVGFKAAANDRRKQLRSHQNQLSSGEKAALAPPPPAVVFQLSAFAALNSNNASGCCLPPDPILAVGPSQVMEAVNSVVVVYDKATGNQLFTEQLSDFFSNLNAAIGYDPQVIYDQSDGRFILTVPGIVNGNQDHVLIAVSADSNPLDGFYEWAIDTSDGLTGNFSDFPKLGLSQSAVYITTDQFAPDGTYADVRVVQLVDLLSGSNTLNVTVFKGVTTASGCSAWAIEPALTYGNTQNEYLAASAFPSFTSTTDQINLFSINTSGIPVLTSTDLTVTAWMEPPSADQPGSPGSVDTDASFLGNAVWQNNMLATAHTVATPDGSAAIVQYYLISLPDASGLTAASVFDTGTVGFGDSYYPAITLNSSGEVGMVFDESGSTEYVSAYVSGKFLSDSLGSIGSPAMFFAGNGVSTNSSRWGDYSGISVDPSDGSFWGAGEPADANQLWTTAIAHFRLKGTTTTVLTSSPNPSALGQPVDFTITVNVTSGSGTPMGQVYLVDGNGNVVASATLSGNTALIHGFVPSSLGSNRFYGWYPGDDNFVGCTLAATCGSVNQVVKYATSTTLRSTPNPSIYGQPVTFAVNVTSGNGTPTGTVSFKNGTALLSKQSLINGIATYTTSTLNAGSRTVSAVYNGSPTYLASSASVVQAISKVATATTIVSSLNPSTYGQAVTFTATVTTAVGSPAGTVVFRKGTTPLGSVSLGSGGIVTFTTTATQLTGGDDSISATYNGDVNHGSSSGVMTQTVNKAPTTTAITSSPNPSTVGQAVTFTASVSAAPGTPGGNVVFKNGTAILATVPLSSGIASYSTSSLSKGTHTIKAVYSGTNDYFGSSKSLTQTVN